MTNKYSLPILLLCIVSSQLRAVFTRLIYARSEQIVVQ
jgi:hypothetical protein